jgi:2-polyprenylphenol 6-hydroxylase
VIAQKHCRERKGKDKFSGSKKPHTFFFFFFFFFFDFRKILRKMQQKVDIAVVGCGLVGSALACALSMSEPTRHLRVAIVEPGRKRRKLDHADRQSIDLRVFALNEGTVSLLRAIDVWPSVERTGRVARFTGMHVWDSQSSGRLTFDAHNLNRQELGYVVENRVLEEALANRLAQLAAGSSDALVLVDDSVRSLDIGKRRNRIHLSSSSSQLTASLVIGADGANSMVRKAAKLGSWGWPYNLEGVVGAFRMERSSPVAYQRFLSSGPVALLPVLDDASVASCVWSCRPEQARLLKSLDADEFVGRLNEALDGRAPRVLSQLSPSLASFPLRFGVADSYVGDGVALVGDAAHTVNPLAGQGLNLGFADAASLAAALGDIMRAGQRIGSRGPLQRHYERRRYASNTAMALALDGISHAFRAGPLAPLRAIAMHAIDSLPSAKHLLHSFAEYPSSMRDDIGRIGHHAI